MKGGGCHNKKAPFYCEVPTPGPTRRWSPSSPPGSLDSSPHSLGYPPAHRVSFASAGIRTRYQELKVLREASLLPTSSSFDCSFVFIILLFFFKVGPTCHFFHSFSVSASKQIISFRFQFYWSYLNILYIFTIFRDFSQIPISSFTLYLSPRNS